MNTSSSYKPGAGGYNFRYAMPGQVLENGYKTASEPQRSHATPAEYFADRLKNGVKLKELRYANIHCDGIDNFPGVSNTITMDGVLKGKTPQIMAEAMKRPEAVEAMAMLVEAYAKAGIKF